MDKTLKQVEQFHKTFNHPVLETPTIPDSSRCELRVSLLQEELNELQEAIDNNDLVEVADALCDLQYVLNGAILEFGLKDKFTGLFNEVQRSNMSKACSTLKEAIETQHKYEDLGQSSVIERQPDETFIVSRLSDNKMLKSVNYSPAELKPLL